MQTFLPFPDFSKTAAVLDRQRLGKQRVECLQILQTLKNGTGWVNHPAVNMWRGRELHLVNYGLEICKEWIRRGYKDTCYQKILDLCPQYPNGRLIPDWITEEFCAAHRSNLLRKNPEFYSKFGWTESDDLPYVWPL